MCSNSCIKKVVKEKSSDIKIIQNETNEINVKIYDKKNKKASIEIKGNTLEIINNNRSNFNIFNFTNNQRIVISVPKNKKYNLDLKATSGDINVEPDMNDTKISVTSGDVSINRTDNLNISVTSGDVSVYNTGNLDANVTSGDIDIKKVKGKINLAVKSGDIKINELDLSKDSSIKASSGDIKVIKTNDIYIDASAKSGDINIDNNNRKADIELKIKTISGDITVNK